MRRLRIALDVDGVLCNFIGGVLSLVREVTGRAYEAADVRVFDFTVALNLSASEAREVKALISSRQGFVASLAPYAMAVQGVQRLRELGDVFCVTSPWNSNPWWKAEREAWLLEHFGINEVHHAEYKRPYEADVFVDDRSKHVGAWAKAWPKGTSVFWRTLHNGSEAVPSSAHVIGSWAALYQIAKRVASEESAV